MGASTAQPRDRLSWPKVESKNLIAPCGQTNAWEGSIRKKPSQYKVTAVIPHLNTPDILEAAVRILELQTEKPYILIIDTGSDEQNCATIENLRSESCEIHYLKSHSWRHPSEPVSVAQDLALSMCQTEYMFCTHADCFLKKRTLIAEWLELMKDYSVVGYRISPRPYPEWIKEFGHTALMFNVVDIKSNHINWDMEAYCKANGRPLVNAALGSNNPDTESNFNRTLQQSGLKTLFIGDEENYVRNNNEHFDHPRSYASSKIYSLEHFKRISPDMGKALDEARQRIYEWKRE